MTYSPPTRPPRDVLKTQAKRLRADLAARGTPISHAQALESIAHQWGARDWNTIAAQTDREMHGYAPGQRVTGRYLGHPFAGVIKAARQSANGYWSLTVRFDTAIDVVASTLFSNFRQQVAMTVNAEGHSPRKTSDGQPQLMLDHPVAA
ncbi:MAG: glyoxalase superfamily protein [Sulfitobacter sp.]